MPVRGVPCWSTSVLVYVRAGWVQGGLYRGTTQPARCKVPMRNCRQEQLAAAARGYWDRPRGYMVRRRGRSCTHPPGPVGPMLGPPWYRTSQIAASGPIRARLTSFLSKTSQNGQVSPEYVEKAYNSPCFQNGPRKSPLGFLRFPFSSAFSHKELLTVF